MKNWLIVLATIGLATALWFHQRAAYQSLETEQAQLRDALEQLHARVSEANTARQNAARRLASLRLQVAVDRASPAQAAGSAQTPMPGFIPPDPDHQGGWPAGADYIYLPKEYLSNIDFRLLDGGRVTEEAAALLGLTPTEQTNVEQSLTNLVVQFRQLQLHRRQKVDPPAEWGGGSFDSGLAYRIPSLSTEIQTLRQAFGQQVQPFLGEARFELLQQAGDSYFRQQLDDLGANERIVGFIWQKESDGSRSLWYGIKDAGHADTFQRVPEPVAPDSQVAYYADLFGVNAPGQ